MTLEESRILRWLLLSPRLLQARGERLALLNHFRGTLLWHFMTSMKALARIFGPTPFSV